MVENDSHKYFERKKVIKVMTSKEVINRTYEGKVCTEFWVKQSQGEGKTPFDVKFKKIDGKEWLMFAFVYVNGFISPYTLSFQMPKENMPLEIIASTGIVHLSSVIKNEIDMKMGLLFDMSEMIK